MKKWLLTFACLITLHQAARSQAQANWTSADMYLGIKKLNVLGSVLYIAAHPDDENTRLIAYLSKDRLLRTGYLSLTRGDGGQNLIGNEQGIELGLVRTQELLAARRIDGGEQFFSRAYDFGFSKNPEETFRKWDHDRILADVVWVIRKFQPDVIITRFPTTGEGGHGHHTASAILANEAFEAAADPSRFADQLKSVKTWQVKRVLWNTFNFGTTNTTREDQLKIDVGGYNPLLGKSYGEIAAESRSQHKSQGFGVPATRGEAIEYFKATKGDQPSSDIMDGVVMTWDRVQGGAKIKEVIDQIISSFDFIHPERTVPALVTLYKMLQTMDAGYWRDKKLEETKELIRQCSGLFMDITTSDAYAIQGDSVRMNFSFNNRLGVDAKLVNVTVDRLDSTMNVALQKNRNINFTKPFYIPLSKPVTQPYWLAIPKAEGYYKLSDLSKVGQPDADPAYNVVVTVNISGQDFRFDRAVKYKFTDPVKGEIYWPLTVIPSYTMQVDPELVVTNQDHQYSFEKIVTSFRNNNNISLRQRSYTGVAIDKDKTNLGKETKTFEAASGKDLPVARRNATDTIFYEDAQSQQPAYEMMQVKYDHIPSITYFKPATAIVRDFDYVIYGKKIGYIPGAGDKVPEALEQMGYEVTLLHEKDLAKNNLDKYDAIITGVRAYNTNEWMNKYYDKLMKYVHEGGNLIVQYNTSNNIGPVKARIAPYAFNISRNRVTDEEAEVTITNPGHPVLNFPNKITQDDFKGWIQERSIYHAADFDSKQYETILTMHDPGEAADAGSLIISKYGKGYFTYTGIVFFRELPAGVPGAYRLMANLIALNRKKGF